VMSTVWRSQVKASIRTIGQYAILFKTTKQMIKCCLKNKIKIVKNVNFQKVVRRQAPL